MPAGSTGIGFLRRRNAALLGLILAIPGALPLDAQTSAPPAPAPLASAAIDRTLYRDGEVRRLTGTFAAWTLVCDEVIRLKKRFCSLKTLAHDPAGTAIAVLTFSTGEDGRPAALMRIPASWTPGTLIEIVPQLKAAGPEIATKTAGKPAAKKAETPKAKPPIMYLRPVRCDERQCTLVWSLPAAHIEALNYGAGLLVRFQLAPEPTDAAVAKLTGGDGPAKVTGTIEAQGFAQAIEAAMNAGK